MRTLWRISNHCNLSGMAGEKSSGRWHTRAPGKRIVYCAEHPALTLIEVLVHLKNRPEFFPDRFQLIKVAIAAVISSSSLDSNLLTSNWQDDTNQTRLIGDNWLAQRNSALLAVPSAAAPESTNYLFNPLHPDASDARIEWCKWIDFDRRLFKIVQPA